MNMNVPFEDTRKSWAQRKAVTDVYNIISNPHDNRCGGTIKMPTQFGKTRVGLIAIDKDIKLFNEVIMIIVPSEQIYNQWKEVLVGNRDVMLTTIHKILINPEAFKELNIGLLIIDEIHELTTEDRLKILTYHYFPYKRIIGLTASYPAEGISREYLDRYCPVVHTISEDHAIKKKWINEYVEYNIGCDLPPDDKAKYDEYSAFMKLVYERFNFEKSFLDTLPGNITNTLGLIFACTSGKNFRNNTGGFSYEDARVYRGLVAPKRGWHPSLDMNSQYDREIDKYFNPSAIFDSCDAYIKCMRKRNKLIEQMEGKMKLSLEIAKKFSKEKIISFSKSTEYAENLTSYLNEHLSVKETIKLHNGESTVIDKPICIPYHSNIKSRPSIDLNTGQYILIQSGPNKGKPRLFGGTVIKREAIDGLRSGKYRIISTAAALDKGFAVSDLNVAIISSGDRNVITHEQRTGRVKQLDFNSKTGIVYIFNLYTKDTHELSKLKDRQTSNRVIWIDSIDEVVL